MSFMPESVSVKKIFASSSFSLTLFISFEDLFLINSNKNASNVLEIIKRINPSFGVLVDIVKNAIVIAAICPEIIGIILITFLFQRLRLLMKMFLIILGLLFRCHA